ncbi:hypothetical protein L0664_15835 [Octadecabacter sp. G9-8]|uniref:IraD/Gp25-like domain-containing protein n=1 Tax=Octadecabacter dasysiphoniae TaxID=2909341 RepID=A0ABS9CZ42_9RHOB|nr:hypothetical protein [Octadecabacter dasysiphoniae]MCF2872547.1 hypothetical protein [Octadecabacter dasysiphoniae]
MNDNTRTLTPAQERKLLKWAPTLQPIFPDAHQYGDIKLGTGPNGTLDLELAQGQDNLELQIRTAIVTALGSDPLNMDHGFGGHTVIAQERDPVMRRELLRFAVLAVLTADPRVKHVERVLIGPEIAAFYGTETPPKSIDTYGTLTVEAQFHIAPGEPVSLTVGPLPTDALL